MLHNELTFFELWGSYSAHLSLDRPWMNCRCGKSLALILRCNLLDYTDLGELTGTVGHACVFSFNHPSRSRGQCPLPIFRAKK